MMQTLLDTIASHFPLEPKDVGDFTKLKVSGMNFSIRQFQARGLGNVAVMTAKGFFGLMKMDTLIISPAEVDMPLLSYDRVNAMGKDTLYLELFDTLLGSADLAALDAVKAQAQALPDHQHAAAWYTNLELPQSIFKRSGKAHRAAFNDTAADFFRAYCVTAQAAAPTQVQAKREKTAAYSEGLLTHGGLSTDIFVKHLGREKTAALFRKVLFATQE